MNEGVKDVNRNTDDEKFKHLDSEINSAVSSTDFTGLIPANSNNDKIDEYNELYDFGNHAPNGNK